MGSRNILFRSAFSVVFAVVFGLHCSAQATNPCGVVARISPATADSVVSVAAGNTLIHFSSQSVNATSVKWLLDGFSWGSTSTDFNYGVGTGVHTISLVAFNGNCSDTATVVYFNAGTPHDIDSTMFSNYGLVDTHEYGTGITAAPDGGFALSGWGSLYNCGIRGLVVKLRDRGCVAWSKEIRDTLYNCGGEELGKIYASSFDSSYYVSGKTFLAKLDKNGNRQWVQRFTFNNNSFFALGAQDITGDPQGNVYLLNGAIDFGWMVTKLDVTGRVVWSKYYQHVRQDPTHVDVFCNAAGIVWLNGHLYITGGVYTSSTQQFFNYVTKINDANGKTEWQYAYYDVNRNPALGFAAPSAYDTLVMVATSFNGQGVVLIDPAGNVRKGITARFNTSFGPHFTKAVADSNSNIYIGQWVEEKLDLQPGFMYYTNFVKIDTALNKYWGMIYGDYYRGYFTDLALNEIEFAAVGMDFGMVTDGIIASRDMRLLKINQATVLPDNFCNSFTTDYTLNESSFIRSDFTWAVDSSLQVKPVQLFNISVKDAYVQSRYSCPDFIDSCSYMKISGPAGLCSFARTYTYHVHRNRKCALQPQWHLPEGVVIKDQTDTTITLKFPGFGVYKINCTLQSCVPAIDSLNITITPKTRLLNIGADTVICSRTSIQLHAGKDFAAYQWQDGSTDSLFTATQPGWYWVQVADSCDNFLRDSILIQPYGGEVISIGPDRVKCNSDTIHLNAPAGFLNYAWTNNYNLSFVTAQNVVVNPLTDTAYYIKAEKLPGCFGYDTVRIKVNHSPLIDLGADKSFCSGDSAVFDAGTGFTQYLWNTGYNLQQLTAKDKGTYSVRATTAEGCKTYDTVKIVSVFTNPVVQLDHDSTLCTGTTRILDAGNFASYVWNDGSTARSIAVSGIGKYLVGVVDNNGCKGGDSTAITTMLPLPRNFLPADTAICSYGSLQLKPLQNFKSYLWNTNELSASITVYKPGMYWAQVTDYSNCAGKDTVQVNLKECMKGIYAPTAFTPNNDGRNDVFRPLLFGNVKRYQLTIYNRWGQVVFQTSELNKGWDGTVAGALQQSNVFTWMCTYQFEGEGLKNERGTVLLIR